MGENYYRLNIDGYFKPGGVLYAPKGTDTLLIQDAKEIFEWDKLIFSLVNGIYMPYHAANIGCNLIDYELKKIIKKYIPENYPIEFLPVKVQSNEYGEREYYIIHFKIIFDVIDPINSLYVEGNKNIIKPCLDFNKVKYLDIFNSRPAINDIIISERLKKEIIKHKLNIGMEFSQLRCK